MLLCHLWHNLAILAVSNALTVESRTSLKVGTGNTSANALSPQAELELALLDRYNPNYWRNSKSV